MPKFVHFEKKIGWSELIAILAIFLSFLAIWQSYLARQDSKIINKLNFKPILLLDTQLKKIENIPPHMTITNKGPVDAVQLQAQLISLQYDPKTKRVHAAFMISEFQWTIDRLPALKKVSIKLNENNLKLPPNWPNKENKILEIRLTYRREVDLKKYSESAFYFLNQEGRYVREDDNSLSPDIYNPIKEAALKRFDLDKPGLLIGDDTLHELIE